MDRIDADRLFAGSGEMVERCRAFDWSITSLGAVEGWSASFRALTTAVLGSRNPMLLFWGPDLVQIYNDAFRPSLGPSTGPTSRHPRGLGMPAAEFWTDVWEVVGPQIEGVMTRGESVWFEDLHLPIERGDGVVSDAWWTYSYSPVRDDDGEIAGTLVVCLETTSAVKAREAVEFERTRLADLFRHAPAFMCVLRGPDHVFELANDNYLKLVGSRDVLGKPARVALPELEGQGLFELLDQVLDTGEPHFGREVPVTVQTSPDGGVEELIVDFVYQPIVEVDGTRSGIFVQGADVTETFRARAAAEEANRSKSEFLTVMSHELRTPLNAIDGYAQLLEEGVHGPLSEAQLHAVGRIRRSERHLLHLIEEVLSFAKLESGKMTLDTRPVPVHDFVAVCESLTEPQRRRRDLEFVVGEGPGDVAVWADPDRLRQIGLNLLSNATKFTDPGGRVTLTWTADLDTVAIAVSDTGRGIAPADMDKIFEPFIQTGSAFKRPDEGIGLGLAISRDLARAMGGDLTAESAVGAGSTFTLTLPRAASMTSAEA